MYNVGLFPNISNYHIIQITIIHVIIITYMYMYITSKVIICSSIFKEGYILFMQEDYFLQNSYKRANEERKHCLTN